ncbi:MAG: response regulator [Niameybacter sp.]
MNLYKIVLVDDEEEIRKGIIRRIKWGELGFSVVGEAENGLEALEVIEKTLPDLVVADIKMPFMDGIHLTVEIRDRFPTIKVIILSGFDDFEYAQEALKLGVIRYILKPINAMEINTLLREVKLLLDEEILSKSNLSTLKVAYKKSLPLLRERFLNQWIEGHTERRVIEENLHALDIQLGNHPLVVAIMRPDEIYKQVIQQASITNKNLLKLAIFNIAEEITQVEKLGSLFARREGFIIVISLQEGEHPKSSSHVFRGLEQIRSAVKKYLNTTLTIGVGSLCNDYTLLYKSYLDATSALDYTITIGNDKLIYLDDIEPTRHVEPFLEEADEHMLLTMIKLGQEEKIEEMIYEFLGQINGECMALREYQIYIVGLLASILKLGRSMKVDMSAVLPQDTNLLEALSRLSTQEEIQMWLSGICLGVARDINNSRKDSKNELIKKAVEYMHLYYEDETLNAEAICNFLHISTTYFSALFKKEMHITFSNYLTQIRIEKAKHLLQTTDKKAAEIGYAVGYPEGHYFSYVFKKITGYAPTEYRNGKV